MNVRDKLAELGLTIPEIAKPVGAYIPAVRSGNLVFTSGQLPLIEGKLRYSGKIGLDLSEEEGYQAAKICALNGLAAINDLLGGLSKVSRIVKVTGFVNGSPDFFAHAGVVNGASELLSQLFPGSHARAAVGVYSLPLNAAVELEMIVEAE